MESGMREVGERRLPSVGNHQPPQRHGLSRVALATRRSSYIRCCELRRAGRTVRERLGVWPADPCDDCFSVMLLQNTDDSAEGKGDGSCDNCLRCATAALIHARVVERCAIRAWYRDFRRLARPASVTVCRVFTMCRVFTVYRIFTECRMLSMGTGGHVSTGHARQSRGEPNTPRADEYAGQG